MPTILTPGNAAWLIPLKHLFTEKLTFQTWQNTLGFVGAKTSEGQQEENKFSTSRLIISVSIPDKEPETLFIRVNPIACISQGMPGERDCMSEPRGPPDSSWNGSMTIYLLGIRGHLYSVCVTHDISELDWDKWPCVSHFIAETARLIDHMYRSGFRQHWLIS